MNTEHDSATKEVGIEREFVLAHKWMMFPIGCVVAGSCAVLVCKRIEPAWVGPLSALVLGGVFLLNLAFVLTWRFVVQQDVFVECSIFGKRELRFDEVAGFTYTVTKKGGGRSILIVPKDARKRNLKMYTLVKGADDFEYWLSGRFADLDAKGTWR